MLNITANADLRNNSTMRLGGTARYLCNVTSRQEVAEAIDWAVANQTPPIMVGSGSNIIWRDEGFDGLVIVNAITGYEVFAEDDINHYVTVGAGENWDSIVARTVQAGLTGIEAMSLVPGTVGGTPIQNVGAYGQDVSQTIVSVQAYDLHTRSFLTIPAADCQFGYRSSRFNGEDRGRFLITNVTFHLMKGSLQPPYYSGLERYFTENNIVNPDPATVRAAVIAIRSSKLPDPATVANCGSFFGNPFVDRDRFLDLQLQYPEMPHWPTDDPGQIKLSAAWLIEQSGYKDFHDSTTGMGTWPSQPLVLVNESAKTTADLLAFRDQVVKTVQERFGVELKQEPELLP